VDGARLSKFFGRPEKKLKRIESKREGAAALMGGNGKRKGSNGSCGVIMERGIEE